MKKIGISILFLFLSFSSKGQKVSQFDGMIISTIKSHLIRYKEYTEIGIAKDGDVHYICYDKLPVYNEHDFLQNFNDSLPNANEKVVFFSLENVEGLPNSMKRKLNKGLDANRMSVFLENDRINVFITPITVTRTRKKHLNSGVHRDDTTHHTYGYSCEKQKWELIESQIGGIVRKN